MNSNQNYLLVFLSALAIIAVMAALLLGQAPVQATNATEQNAAANAGQNHPVSAVGDMKNKPDSYWKAKLSPEAYIVTRKQGTEPAFTGAYWNNHKDGNYYCSNCGALLFTSKEKFDSGTGWPSFFKPADKKALAENVDKTMFMQRTELICANCGAHLGHVFDDGPKPTGQRYCINSCALDFKNNAQIKNAATNHEAK